MLRSKKCFVDQFLEEARAVCATGSVGYGEIGVANLYPPRGQEVGKIRLVLVFSGQCSDRDRNTDDHHSATDNAGLSRF